jgi:hypothetical protein
LIEQHPGQLGVVIVELTGQRLDEVVVPEPHPAAGHAGQHLRVALSGDQRLDHVPHGQIDTLTTRIDAVLADLPNAPPRPEPDPDDHGPGPHPRAAQARSLKGSTSGGPAPATGTTPTQVTVLDLIDILDEIPGIGRHNAQEIIAEIGLDMTRFPTADHLVSWAKLCPRTIQSGRKSTTGKTGKGNRYLRAVLGDAAAGAGKTQTFLGDRYRRLIGRRGKLKTLVAVARSILVIIWHLLANPGMRYQDLGVHFHTQRMDVQRRTRNHVRQLEAMGYTVTLNAAAA